MGQVIYATGTTLSLVLVGPAVLVCTGEYLGMKCLKHLNYGSKYHLYHT